MDILYLVDRLENIIASSRKMPLLNQIVFKENDVITMLNLLEQMHNSIPGEFEQARRVTQERDRILAQAQAEAAALREKAQAEAAVVREKAREESDRALNREGLLRVAEERSQEILRQAKEQARDIMRRAEEHTEQMKAEADAYAAETLQNLKEHLASVESHLATVESEVSRNILSIEKGLESLEAQKYEEIYASDEHGEDNELEDADPLDSLAEEQMPVYPLPRRSSLANDTMGGPNIPHSGS